MKNLIAVLTIVALTTALSVSVRSCTHHRDESKQLAEAYQEILKRGLDEPLEIIRTVRDTVYGISAVTTKPVQTLDPTMYISKGYADTLVQALNIAARDIQSLQRQKITLQDSIKGLLERDALGVRWASIRDSVFDIRYNLDSNIFYPRVTLDLDIIGHRQPGSLFRKAQFYSSVLAHDPRVVFSHIRQVNKVSYPSRFGLDITAGAVFTPQGLTYGVAAGLGYRLIEF